ncbi:3-methyl-2-oxobutanoate dehydrogenase subunit beta [Geoglobus acetivorans]|uniref:3-methyl-2-oxobutanoate dehydrogenase subunit beta n=1 Tax=Geoglobus acetivorans TaxID=565033 RepID=A0ABZ3H607_GEOAI|nr:3-methyl-2-oxobutanoate dehydrogenase subunit beta [Geoglobus acetivorans]
MKISDIPEKEYLLPGNAACHGCASSMCLRTVLKAIGKRTVLVVPASCTSVYQGMFPGSAIDVPVFNTVFAASASTASGIKASLEKKGVDATVVVWAGDGGTYDIGLQALSAAAERNEDILYVCYNNEMYSNTGVQRSGATPYGAWTTTTWSGKKEHRKDVAEMMIAHDIPYVATASAGYLTDLYKKIRKAKNVKGFRYVEILAPCPPGWKYPMDRTVEMGRMAVETGMWILYEYENGEFRLTGLSKAIAEGKRELKDVEEYLLAQGRFAHLSQKDIGAIREYVERRWSNLAKLAGGVHAASAEFYV